MNLADKLRKEKKREEQILRPLCDLFFTVGIQGAGKSTFAKAFAQENNIDYLSSDEMREVITGDASNMTRDRDVWEEIYRLIENNLGCQESLILDSTNRNSHGRKKILEFAKQYNCRAHAIVLQTTLDLCKARNDKRERKVPEEAIDKFYSEFRLPLLSEGLNTIVIVDGGTFTKKSSLVKIIKPNFEKVEEISYEQIYKICLKE